MSGRDPFQKAARRLSREFPEWAYSSLLRKLRDGATEALLRETLTKQRTVADAELVRLRK